MMLQLATPILFRVFRHSPRWPRELTVPKPKKAPRRPLWSRTRHQRKPPRPKPGSKRHGTMGNHGNVLGWSWISSGRVTKLWKITILNGKIHYKWAIFHSHVSLPESIMLDPVPWCMIWLQEVSYNRNNRLANKLMFFARDIAKRERERAHYMFPCLSMSNLQLYKILYKITVYIAKNTEGEATKR